MNALLIVCGLGFVSLLSEIINFKKGLHTIVIAGLIAAGLMVAQDWNTAAYYFNNMLIAARRGQTHQGEIDGQADTQGTRT